MRNKFRETYRLVYTDAFGKDTVLEKGLTLDKACQLFSTEHGHYRHLHICVDPFTCWQFLQLKMQEFRSIPSEAKMWSRALMSGGPMDEVEYAQFVALTGDADGVNRLRCRTLVGWYGKEFLDCVTRWNKSAYERTYSDQAVDYYIDWKDERRADALTDKYVDEDVDEWRANEPSYFGPVETYMDRADDEDRRTVS